MSYVLSWVDEPINRVAISLPIIYASERPIFSRIQDDPHCKVWHLTAYKTRNKNKLSTLCGDANLVHSLIVHIPLFRRKYRLRLEGLLGGDVALLLEHKAAQLVNKQ